MADKDNAKRKLQYDNVDEVLTPLRSLRKRPKVDYVNASPAKTSRPRTSSSTIPETAVDASGNMVCHLCKGSLPRYISMERHLEAVHEVSIVIIDKVQKETSESNKRTREQTQKPRRRIRIKSHNCENCNLAFKNRTLLANHAKVCPQKKKNDKANDSRQSDPVSSRTNDNANQTPCCPSTSSSSATKSNTKSKSTTKTVRFNKSSDLQEQRINRTCSKRCQKCNQEFKNPKALSDHRRECNAVVLTPPKKQSKECFFAETFKCYVCFEKIPRNEYRPHLEEEHRKSPEEIEEQRKRLMKKKEIPGPNFVFTCELCPNNGICFQKIADLLKHKQKYHKKRE